MVLRGSHARPRDEGLWPLVLALERRLLGLGPNPWQRIAVEGERDVVRISGASELVAGASDADRPDLVLDFTGVEDTRAWAARARLGLLRVRFGDAFDETGIGRALMESRPWLALRAELVTPEEVRELESTVMRLASMRSLASAQDGAARRAGQLLIRAIARLHHGQGGVAGASPDPGSSAPETATLHGTPARLSGRGGLALLIKGGTDLAVRRARSALVRVNHWFLAYRTRQDKFIANCFEMSGDGLEIFRLDPARFYVDPCVFAYDGVDHVFFEDYSYVKKKGVISWSRLQDDGTLSPPVVVLEEPTHLSYPFVFSYRGAVYMLPESSAQREIALYEAVDFPRQWRKATVLFENVTAGDATLHVHDDRWWMFVSLRHDGFGASDELFLFHARGPFGPWTAHPRNPIKSDVRSARPAGRLFYRGDRLIRPAQDGSVTYGGALALCEVQELTTASYRETVVKRLDPGWLAGNRGFHTLSFSDRIEVIDGKLDLPRWRAPACSGSGAGS